MNHITIERQVGIPRTRHIKVFVDKNLRVGSKDKNTEITAEIPAVKDVQSMLKISIIIFISFYQFLSCRLFSYKIKFFKKVDAQENQLFEL